MAHAEWLQWRAPSGCPQQAEVARSIEAQLQRRASAAGDLTAEAVISADAGGFTLKLTVHTRSRDSARTLSAARCADLTEAAAFLLAMAVAPRTDTATIDEAGQRTTRADGSGLGSAPSVAADPVPARREPETSEQPQAESVASETASVGEPETKGQPDALAPPASRGPAPPWWFELGLDAGIWGAGLPGAQASLGGAVAVGRGSLFAALSAMGALPRSAASGPAGDVRTHTLGAGIAVCYELLDPSAAARLSAAPCLSGQALRSHADALDIAASRAANSLWFAGGPMLTASARIIGPLRVRLELGLGFPLSARPKYTIDAYGSVESANFTSGFARLGVGARF